MLDLEKGQLARIVDERDHCFYKESIVEFTGQTDSRYYFFKYVKGGKKSPSFYTQWLAERNFELLNVIQPTREDIEKQLKSW